MSTAEMFRLDGKVVVVTGGTKRYGYCLCAALAEAGGTVILTSRDQKRADDSAKTFTDKGYKVFGSSLDLADDNSINEFVAEVIKTYKRIDVLVNNARHIPGMPYYSITRKELDKSFTINSVGTMLLTRSVVEEMKKAGGGNIINISSIYGMVGQDTSIYKDPDANITLDYPIQKGGMIAYTRQLAAILGQYGIRVNCLSLGGLSGASQDPYFVERYNKRVPLGRMATAEDVRGPIVFMASGTSVYMTGANLVVDGGWTIW